MQSEENLSPEIDTAPSITLALVSHTNVGKTTLARTLLRRDVGEVLDQAHVTDEATVYTILSTDAGELRLADTPGFGDSARLLQRLRTHERPVLWFVQQTWDRFADRPFWCSQRAALAIREYADVVLYLVNATEEPEEAGYVDFELELLDWIGVPVVILLNQTGDTSFRKQLSARWLERWRAHTEPYASVKNVFELDAFARCWVEEGALLARLGDVLPTDQAPLMDALRSGWQERNLEIFDRSVRTMADYVATTATDREAMPVKRPSREQKAAAMEVLGRRLLDRTEGLMTSLLAHHDLRGDVAGEIDRQLDAFAVSGDALDTERSAILGSVVSGAVGGLAADLLAGGLTFGGGMLAGAILGALGGVGLARGYQLIQGDRLPEVGWSAGFLDRLLAQTLLRYLAVAHFGRGRGEFKSEEASRPWQDAVADVLRQQQEEWHELWPRAQKQRRETFERAVEPYLRRAAAAVLVRGYPEARDMLGSAIELPSETTSSETRRFSATSAPTLPTK